MMLYEDGLWRPEGGVLCCEGSSLQAALQHTIYQCLLQRMACIHDAMTICLQTIDSNNQPDFSLLVYMASGTFSHCHSQVCAI